MNFRPLRTQTLLLVTLFAGVLSLATWANADIYRYVDSSGVMHFRNRPSGGGYSLYLRTPEHHRTRGGANPVSPSDVSPERFSRYSEWIRQAAALYQLPEELVRAVIMVESNYDPRAVSSAGASGLMQLMPETASRMEVQDINDPRENIFGGVRYLRVLANLLNGDLPLTVAAYNAGEGAVFRYGGIPPYAETQDYVVKVLSYYRRYRLTRDVLEASMGTDAAATAAPTLPPTPAPPSPDASSLLPTGDLALHRRPGFLVPIKSPGLAFPSTYRSRRSARSTALSVMICRSASSSHRRRATSLSAWSGS